MPLHLWEAIHDADVRSDPLFAIDPSLVGSTPPSLQRVLLAAATLWCRTLTWPTVREISTTAGVAASTSIAAAGSSPQLRELLIESERRTIDQLWLDRAERFDSEDAAYASASRSRVQRLAAIEQPLAALPMLTGLALGLPLMAIAAMGPYQESVVAAFRDAAAVA